MTKIENFLTKWLITYLWNKRKLIKFIEENIKLIIENDDELKNKDLIILDWFAWSWVVSRMLKLYSKTLYVNDYEEYSYIVNNCYLPDRSIELNNEIEYWIKQANNIKLKGNWWFILEKYAPKDDENIKPWERVFFTNNNAKIIDNIRNFIETKVPKHIKPYILWELIQKASIHNNTSGVFKWFHKKNWIWHFWWKWENALKRIKWEITLDNPIYFNTWTNVIILKWDTNKIVKEIPEPLDIAYFDPPYNQHPYGSNYWILNIISNNWWQIQENWVSWIPKDWYRSEWNKKNQAITALEKLVKNTNSKYLVFSYNNEWIIPIEIFKNILEEYGNVKIIEKKYNTYKWSRNLKNRNKYVKELLWILHKK